MILSTTRLTNYEIMCHFRALHKPTILRLRKEQPEHRPHCGALTIVSTVVWLTDRVESSCLLYTRLGVNRQIPLARLLESVELSKSMFDNNVFRHRRTFLRTPAIAHLLWCIKRFHILISIQTMRFHLYKVGRIHQSFDFEYPCMPCTRVVGSTGTCFLRHGLSLPLRHHRLDHCWRPRMISNLFIFPPSQFRPLAPLCIFAFVLKFIRLITTVHLESFIVSRIWRIRPLEILPYIKITVLWTF